MGLGPEDPVKEKIYDITKNSTNSGSESDTSSVMELNEKLLEAHKKVVQQKMNREVARTISNEFESKEQGGEEKKIDEKSDEEEGRGRPGNLRKFAPRLEEIEEEEGKREEERKIINSSVEEEEDEDQEGSRKRMMGSFHSS